MATGQWSNSEVIAFTRRQLAAYKIDSSNISGINPLQPKVYIDSTYFSLYYHKNLFQKISALRFAMSLTENNEWVQQQLFDIIELLSIGTERIGIELVKGGGTELIEAFQNILFNESSMQQLKRMAE